MSLVEQHLGCDILWGATQSIGTSSWLDDLRKTKVRELAVAVSTDQEILRLEVAMDDVFAVAVSEGCSCLKTVEL